MNHELEELIVVSDHNSVVPTRRDKLVHNDYSDIPMVSLPKRPIDWSQTSQEQTAPPAKIPSTADTDNLQESEVVV